MNKLTIAFATAALALAALHAPAASAQGSTQGYLVDTRGGVVKNPYGLCWRTGFWSPALAIEECDPDLVPRRPPPPAPATPPPPPPPPKPAAPPPPPKPAAPAAAKRCDTTITFQNQELFEFNKSNLTPAARERLDRDVIGRLPSCSTLEAIIIEGHTDRIGSQQYNQKLSERRAESVKAYLISKGVDRNKIETIGMGKTVPAKFCPDSRNRKELIACLAPNRRAIVTLKGPGR